jgi:hypothetical protein
MSVLVNRDGILCCPACGGENLHQEDVEVFNRRVEDAPSCVVVVDHKLGIALDGDPARNPSSRRQGLLVTFLCETCGDLGRRHTLEIAQHKGNTFVRWQE